MRWSLPGVSARVCAVCEALRLFDGDKGEGRGMIVCLTMESKSISRDSSKSADTAGRLGGLKSTRAVPRHFSMNM